MEKYKIVKVLGVGGFGIAYLAEHISLNNTVVIKEYFPNEFSTREPNTHYVHPKDPTSAESYQYGLKTFLNEAKTIEEFDHPNIVRVRDYFEANNTAYIVMQYTPGSTLSELAKGETASEEEIYAIIIPLLKGLKDIHKHGYMHRDIKPSNIYIHDKTQRPVLIDFGAAKYSLGSRSRSITSVVTLGYSPYEQYDSKGNLGPWTDVYALGCVVYRLIYGKIPTESAKRVMDVFNDEKDPLIPAIEIGKRKYTDQLLTAVDHAMAIREKDRPQSATEWLNQLQHAKDSFECLSQQSSQPRPQPLISEEVTKSTNNNKKNNLFMWLGTAVVAFGFSFLGYQFFDKASDITNAEAETFVRDYYREQNSDTELAFKWDMLPQATKNEMPEGKPGFIKFWTRTVDRSKHITINTESRGTGKVHALAYFPLLQGGTQCSDDRFDLIKSNNQIIIKKFTFDECSEQDKQSDDATRLQQQAEEQERERIAEDNRKAALEQQRADEARERIEAEERKLEAIRQESKAEERRAEAARQRAAEAKREREEASRQVEQKRQQAEAKARERQRQKELERQRQSRNQFANTIGYSSLIREANSLGKKSKGTRNYCTQYVAVSVKQQARNDQNNCKLEINDSPNRWSYAEDPQYNWCLTAWSWVSKGEAQHRESKLKTCLK